MNIPFLGTYERDGETGLDFAQARYYANGQGRFTGIDPLLSTGKPWDPQTWNRYSYSLNNPLFYIDPSGMFVFGSGVSDKDRQKIINSWVKLNQALNEHKKGSKAYNNIKRALDKLGRPGQDNGVTVNVGVVSRPNANGEADVSKIDKGKATITFNKDKFDSASENAIAGTLGHESSHVADAFQLFSTVKTMSSFAKIWNDNDSQYKSEFEAFFVNAGVHQALDPGTLDAFGAETPIPGQKLGIPSSGEFWNPSWAALDVKAIESRQAAGIDALLQTPKKGNYGPSGYGLKRLFGNCRKRPQNIVGTSSIPIQGAKGC